MSQSELAVRCNISKNTVYRAESRPHYTLQFNNAVKISRVLDAELPLTEEEWLVFIRQGGLAEEVWKRAVAGDLPHRETVTIDPEARAAVVDAALGLLGYANAEDVAAFLNSLKRLLARAHSAQKPEPIPAIVTPPEPLGDTHEVRTYIPTSQPGQRSAVPSPKRRASP